MNNDKQIAETIFQQLGGNKFISFTGAKDLMAGKDHLAFKLPSNFAKDGINYVKITLDDTDTYTMEFQRWNWAKGDCLFKDEFKEIYCADLQALFTNVTDLQTHF